MRRYSGAINAIERIRLEYGLADSPTVPSIVPLGQGAQPGSGVHPLPLYQSQVRAPSPHPLPLLPAGLLNREESPQIGGGTSYEIRQRPQLADLPRGGEQAPIQVWPAWESRMPDMRDFLRVVTIEPAAPATVLFQTQVPIGWTAFWKRFRLQLDPIPGAFAAGDVLVTLQVDGNVVPDYFSLPIGPGMSDYLDTFVIAAEGRFLQLSVRFNVALPVGTDAIAWFYGNLKPRSGEGEAREVGVRPPPPRPVIVQVPALSAPRAAESPPVCVPGEQLMRVQLADGTFAMRCVRVLGQARRS